MCLYIFCLLLINKYCVVADIAGKDSAPRAPRPVERHPHRGPTDSVDTDATDRSRWSWWRARRQAEDRSQIDWLPSSAYDMSLKNCLFWTKSPAFRPWISRYLKYFFQIPRLLRGRFIYCRTTIFPPKYAQKCFSGNFQMIWVSWLVEHELEFIET